MAARRGAGPRAAAPARDRRGGYRRGRDLREIRRQMRELMTAYVGVQRTESSLLHAEQTLSAHRARPGRRLAHPQPAAGGTAHHPGRTPAPREPGRPPPADYPPAAFSGDA